MPLNTLEIKTLKILHAIKYEGVRVTKGVIESLCTTNRVPPRNAPRIQRYILIH